VVVVGGSMRVAGFPGTSVHVCQLLRSVPDHNFTYGLAQACVKLNGALPEVQEYQYQNCIFYYFGDFIKFSQELFRFPYLL
jgi:hypothetical protein